MNLLIPSSPAWTLEKKYWKDDSERNVTTHKVTFEEDLKIKMHCLYTVEPWIWQYW